MLSTLTPVTRNIIIACAALFILSYLYPLLNTILAAYYPGSPNFQWYQVITHMFMHGGIMHIAFNMLTLWSFGPVIEHEIGARRYTWLYLLSGLGAFALFNLWNYYEVSQVLKTLHAANADLAELYRFSNNNYRGDYMTDLRGEDARNAAVAYVSALRTPMVGASGAIFGVLSAFTMLFPNAKMYIMFIPFPVKAKILLPIVLIGSIYLGMTDRMGSIAHFAHVGGAIVGLVMAWFWKRNHYRLN